MAAEMVDTVYYSTLMRVRVNAKCIRTSRKVW